MSADRTALEDVAIRDQMISAGEIVQLSIAAANRDPSHFPVPDTFDAARNPHGVLSFGHRPHGCLGARLAKEQATIALEVLFRRLGTDFRLDPAREVRRYRNAGNRGPEVLPVSFASG
jgi:cytochrome P450